MNRRHIEHVAIKTSDNVVYFLFGLDLVAVDAEDFWRIKSVKLKMRGKSSKHLYETRFGESLASIIMRTPGLYDHRDGNPLNNTKKNLRPCSKTQNAWNHKKEIGCIVPYKGVVWHKKDKKYHARITANGKTNHLGCFVDMIEAARAYDLAAKQFHGEFARLNF